jgi:hypothetical protein
MASVFWDIEGNLFVEFLTKAAMTERHVLTL